MEASDFRNGVTFVCDGQPCQVIEFQHVKPGKGAAFVRTKYKNIAHRCNQRQEQPYSKVRFCIYRA